MLLSRRQMIEAGAATGALAAMSSPLLAAGRRACRSAPTGPMPPRRVPARPRVTVDPVDRSAPRRPRPRRLRPPPLARSRHIDVVGIVDFTKASAEPRFYLLDTNSGRVTRHLVAHGRGSDPAHTGFLQRFSNRLGSEASSNGAYVTGDYYPGHYGRSMRVRGLDHSNSNAEARAIVVHSAWYAEPDVARRATAGSAAAKAASPCPISSLQEVLARLGPGRFLYADRLA